MKREKYHKKKYTNLILILAFLAVLGAILLVLIYSNMGGGNRISISDTSVIGKWKYFATSKGEDFYKDGLNEGQYVNLKKDGSASLKITREIKDADWSEIKDGVAISYGNRDINLHKKGDVLTYEKDGKAIYFVKNNGESEYKDEILSKIDDTKKREQNAIVSEIDKKDSKTLNGEWYRFAYENKEGLVEIPQDKISEDDAIIIDNKKLTEYRDGESIKGTLKFNKEDKIIEVSQDKEDGIILQMDEILAFIKDGENNYYSKDNEKTNSKEEFINKLKEQKGEKNE